MSIADELASCSMLARTAREPLGGTASHARGCVLLSYPKRLWGRDALRSEGLPDAVVEALARMRDEDGVATRFVAHEGPWEGRTEICTFPAARRHRDVRMEDAAALLRAPSEGEPIDTPIVAVCTHGQRDRCCARFGLELVRALRDVAGGSIDVREASHLGGDRFAPTVLVLPSGHMYGHLETSDASALALAVRGGTPLASRFRGSLWLDPLSQLAEVAALALRPDARPELGPIETLELDPRRRELRAEVRWDGERSRLVVRCASEQRRVYGDCRSADLHRLGGFDAWVIEDARIEPLE